MRQGLLKGEISRHVEWSWSLLVLSHKPGGVVFLLLDSFGSFYQLQLFCQVPYLTTTPRPVGMVQVGIPDQAGQGQTSSE